MSEHDSRDETPEEAEEHRMSRGVAVAISVAAGTPILVTALPLILRH